MGAFSPSRINYWTGKIAATAYILNQYRRSTGTTSDKVDTGGKLFGVWGMPMAYATSGWVIVQGIKNPTTLTITYAFLAGAYTSSVIDEEEGEANYWGFVSGGWFGNDPNYLTGDENNSGYFNVLGNVSTILAHQDSSAIAKAAAEKAFIADYWYQKEAENWEAMVMAYNSLSPSKQREIQDKIRAALP